MAGYGSLPPGAPARPRDASSRRVVAIAVRVGAVAVLSLTCAAVLLISQWSNVTELLAKRAAVRPQVARQLVGHSMATQSLMRRISTAKQTMGSSSGLEARALKGEVQKLSLELKKSQARENALRESPPVPAGAPPEGANQLGFVTGDRFGKHVYWHDGANSAGEIAPVKESDKDRYWWGEDYHTPQHDDVDVDEDPYEIRQFGASLLAGPRELTDLEQLAGWLRVSSWGSSPRFRPVVASRCKGRGSQLTAGGVATMVAATPCWWPDLT
jgi:hypothetical protein